VDTTVVSEYPGPESIYKREERRRVYSRVVGWIPCCQCSFPDWLYSSISVSVFQAQTGSDAACHSLFGYPSSTGYNLMLPKSLWGNPRPLRCPLTFSLICWPANARRHLAKLYIKAFNPHSQRNSFLLISPRCQHYLPIFPCMMVPFITEIELVGRLPL